MNPVEAAASPDLTFQIIAGIVLLLILFANGQDWGRNWAHNPRR